MTQAYQPQIREGLEDPNPSRINPAQSLGLGPGTTISNLKIQVTTGMCLLLVVVLFWFCSTKKVPNPKKKINKSSFHIRSTLFLLNSISQPVETPLFPPPNAEVVTPHPAPRTPWACSAPPISQLVLGGGLLIIWVFPKIVVH